MHRRHPRPGKKRRIVLRKRHSAKIAAEDAEKEKRTRRNREKKVKKKMRDKAKKEADKVARDVDEVNGTGKNEDVSMTIE